MKLRDAKIMSYSSLLALNDDEFIRAMYGAKAVVEKKPSKTTVHIGKDNPNHTKKDLYDSDFQAQFYFSFATVLRKLRNNFM